MRLRQREKKSDHRWQKSPEYELVCSGFYSMHINAFYDLNRHIYTDALIQPAHQKDEFAAFCQLVDSHVCIPDTKTVFIGDRGYCSYNNMAHVIEKG